MTRKNLKFKIMDDVDIKETPNNACVTDGMVAAA